MGGKAEGKAQRKNERRRNEIAAIRGRTERRRREGRGRNGAQRRRRGQRSRRGQEKEECKFWCWQRRRTGSRKSKKINQ